MITTFTVLKTEFSCKLRLAFILEVILSHRDQSAVEKYMPSPLITCLIAKKVLTNIFCSTVDALGIFRVAHISGRLERLAQKLAITVVNSDRAVNALFAILAELFDTRLRIVTCDASRKIPMFMKRWRLAKQHSVTVAVPCTGEWTGQ
mgnify:CR=1 FL=1